jgi:5-methylcytosine-specific restriction endonuclease McrA
MAAISSSYTSDVPAAPNRRARWARRRQRRLARYSHDLTDAQWAALTDAWGGCAYCGATDATGTLQRDCILAISRGGRYTLDNVVPACRSCNASKSNGEVTRWLRRRRFDEQRFLLRHVAINAELARRLRTGSDGP